MISYPQKVTFERYYVRNKRHFSGLFSDILRKTALFSGQTGRSAKPERL